jgi:predicted Zn-dependent protease
MWRGQHHRLGRTVYQLVEQRRRRTSVFKKVGDGGRCGRVERELQTPWLSSLTPDYRLTTMVWSRQFMAEAGYDPRAALDLWDLMAAVEADAASRGQPLSLSDRLSLLQTHPTSNVRQDVS